MKSWWQEKVKGQTGAGAQRVPVSSPVRYLFCRVPGILPAGVYMVADPSGEMAKAWNAFSPGRYYRVDSQGRVLQASRGPYRMAGGGLAVKALRDGCGGKNLR